MKDSKIFAAGLFEKIFELNSKNKIGASTITVFTFILYKCEDLGKEIVLSDYEMARELGLSRQTVITAKNKLKLLGILNCERNRGFPNRFILNVNESPIKASKKVEIKEIPIEELYPVPEVKMVVNIANSKYPTLHQFMDFAKTLKDYSITLDDQLIQKFHQWETSDWKNAIGRPILDWQSVLEKNINIIALSLPRKNNSAFTTPNIRRPEVE